MVWWILKKNRDDIRNNIYREEQIKDLLPWLNTKGTSEIVDKTLQDTINEYLEQNEGHNYSQAHKEFNRSLHKQLEWKKKTIEMLQSFGMDSDMAKEHLCKMIENSKKKEVHCEEIVMNESPRL